jgi:hypothetical protein
MTTAPEPEPDHSSAAPPLRVDSDDGPGRLLAALLAVGGVTRPVAESALAETG